MRQQQIILMTVVMFMFLIFIAAGGYYYTTTLEEEEKTEIKTEKKSGSCTGMDANGVYEYNDEGNCVLKKCKEGSTLQANRCIKIVENDVFVASPVPAPSSEPAPSPPPPPPPQDCIIGGYTLGKCLSIDTNEPMTGFPDSCGVGIRTLTARDITPAKYGGNCENITKTEQCEVPCPKECNATDDNYTPDGACMSQGKELGDLYCGTGMQTLKLDPNTVTGFSTDDLRDAWIGVNWEVCQKIKSEPCEVECVPGKVRTDCPELDNSIQKSYVVDNFNNPICFKTDYAQSVLESGGVLNRSSENILQPVNADEMWDSDNFEYKPTPTGKKIAYRVGGGMSYDDMITSGCVNFELEDCTAEEIPASCKVDYDTEIEGCTPVLKCGDQSHKTLQDIIVRPPFGSGDCSGVNLSPRTVSCDVSEPECCDRDKNHHWTDVNTTCDKATGLRELITANCSNLGQNTPTKSQECRVNCAGYWDTEWSTCSAQCGNGNKTKQWHTTVTPLNGGNPCPASQTQSQSCLIRHCPVNCEGSYGDEELVSNGRCDRGSKELKYRQLFNVTQAPLHGGDRCPATIERTEYRQCAGGYIGGGGYGSGH